MDELTLAPELGLLERFYSDKKNSNTDYHISVFDCFGHILEGRINKLDKDNGYLVLAGNDTLTFVRLSHIAHFKLHHAERHSRVLTNKTQRSSATEPSKNIDVLDHLDMLQSRLSSNYGVEIAFTFDDSCQSFLKSEPLSSLIQALEQNLVELAKDEFANAELATLSQCIISHRQDDRLRVKRDKSQMTISTDLTTSLGFKLFAQLESGLNKIL